MAQTFNSKLPIVAARYIKQLPVNPTKNSVTKSIEEGPFYPDLLRLCDALTRYNYNVPNNAVSIKAMLN